jgi:hypothetical protein
MKMSHRSSDPRRGSLLIVAMLLSAIIAISLTSYIRLSRTALTISNRAFYNNAAVNLAEQGIEEAMYALNQNVADASYAWPGWTISGTNAYREWTGVTLSQGATASYRVYVYNYSAANLAAKTVISRSRVTLGGVATAPIEKWIKVTCRKTSKFANGLVAKTSITFNGNNATVDSWNSDPDNNAATAAIKYDSTVKHDLGSVGSISVSVGAVAVNNADIYGYASTGGSLPTVGSQGRIGPFGTGNGVMDMSRVNTDFTANFDPVTAPTGSYSTYAGAITTSVSLPRAGVDTVMGTGIYAGYYMITADSVNFNNQTLTITGKVILKLTNTITSIDIGGGSGALNINPGATLQVYGAGDFKIAGNGIMNGGTTDATANQPINCQFYGTKTTGVQDIQIAGNGVLSSIVYAPQGSLKINGNGSVMGSYVANDITVVGNANFHYDESLGNYGGNNPFRISSWKELTSAADRSTSEALAVNW